MNLKGLLIVIILNFTGGYFGVLVASDFECVSFISRREVINNTLYSTDTIVYQVNNRYGEQNSDFTIHYSKTSKISKVKAWIEDLNGNRVRDLEKSEIQDRSWIPGTTLYQDDRIKSFQLKHNKYPYRACYTYTLNSSQFNIISDWNPSYGGEYSIKESRLYVIIPKDYLIRSYIRNVSSVKTDTLAGKIVTEYLVKGNAAASVQSGDSPFNLEVPEVIIVPLAFDYGIRGSSESWATFGNWCEMLNNGLGKLPETEMSKVSQMLEGITDTVSIIKTLYQYLQDNVRYANVSIGIGGYKTFPASYVVQNKYGDCKALTNYMKALLAYRGIKSHFVLINSGDQPEKLIESFPSPQFNHILLAVPVAKDTFWIENTTNIDPFGYVGSFTQNRKALFIDGNNSHLVSMPALKRRDVLSVRNINVVLDEKGDADFSAIFSTRGPSYESLNALKHYCAEKDKNDFIDKYIPFWDYELINWKLGETNRDSAKIDLHLRLTIPKMAKMMGNDCYIRSLPIPVGFKIPAPVNLSAFLPWPVCNIDSVIYSFPSGFNLKILPNPVHISSDFGDYISEYTVKENKIFVYKKIEIYQSEYSIAEYDRLYAFVKAVRESENSISINLTKIQE